MKPLMALACLLLAGCQTYPPAPNAPAAAHVNPHAALATAKQAIAYTLKDPESVRWRRAKVSPTGNVCIEVNAKNSFGGYTGFQVVTYHARTGDVLTNGAYACYQRGFMQPGSVTVNAG